ncbi:hypothetical protein F5141DRAFT_1190910 [Pisolithus sp. B1]|nr:hypothetical protein F5141DRAFT_1190910 [Pisolithus sp. B1]
MKAAQHHATLPYKPHHLYPNEVLIYHGYIGCSPVLPTVAISLRFTTYHQIHRICPRFSIQAQCKLLCHLHNTPYHPYLNIQLTITYDVYLNILDRVDCQLKKALGCGTNNWQMLNSCPACFYRLEDEPVLDFNWLSNHDGDTDNWQNLLASTNPDIPTSFTYQQKRMFSMFHESGIFIASCQHRFVLLACNMVKSSELTKYPLAIISKLLSAYGKNGGCAYDIGCAFSATL